jgi:hypothetical protein
MTDFRPQQTKEIRKLLARPPVMPKDKEAESFLLHFVFLEALIRTVGRYYRDRQTKKKKAATSDEPLNIDVVRRSLAYFGILVSEERLTLLLDSAQIKRNSKSARQLRNGLIHRWDVSDAREVAARYGPLRAAITGVIEAVDTRVNGDEQ